MGGSVPLVYGDRSVGDVVVRFLPQHEFLRHSVLGCNTAPWTWLVRLRSRPVHAPYQSNGVDALRVRLEAAKGRVAESERLVAGWKDIVESEQAAGRDVSVGRDLLNNFQTRLEAAMSHQEQAENDLARRLLDLFEVVKGRLPANDQELHEWLASFEGKAATAFEPTSLSPGER
jgi:hypothetical protein